MSGKNSRVVKYRKQKRINIGILVFLAIFIYLTIYMVVYFTREKVTIYEVVMGKNASISNKTFTGLILRDEKPVSADTSGYLNYFVKEGERVSSNSTVYTIDESGTINSILANASETGDIVYSTEAENELRNMISQYTCSNSNISFDNIYDFKLDLEARILEGINLDKIQQLLTNIDKSGMQFKINTSVSSGIVAYYVDGYEEKSEATLTKNDFSTENYSKKAYNSGDLIESGSGVYKVINSEEWNIFIELNEDEVEKYKDYSVMKIRVMSDGNEILGNFSIVYIEGQAYGKIALNKYMNTYVKERFLEVQIDEKQVEGLKIPKSSVVEKDFFIVPVEFIGKGGDTTDIGFFKRVYDENQKESISFIPPTIYYKTDEYYYIEKSEQSEFQEGDIVVMADSSNTYRIGNTEPLEGVYNVNNGYCVFRQISKLTESGDYYLVETNTAYGLKVYDHIVMDGSIVHEKQVVFSVN